MKLRTSGSANVDSATFTANVYLETTDGAWDLDRYLMLGVWNGSDDSRHPLFGISWNSPDQWVQVSTTISLASATHIGLNLGVGGD